MVLRETTHQVSHKSVNKLCLVNQLFKTSEAPCLPDKNEMYACEDQRSLTNIK